MGMRHHEHRSRFEDVEYPMGWVDMLVLEMVEKDDGIRKQRDEEGGGEERGEMQTETLSS